MRNLMIFHASFCRFGRMGYMHERRAVVVANSESEALGFLLMEYQDTDRSEWTLTQIADDSPKVIQISEVEHC